jgi:hypothetical protein
MILVELRLCGVETPISIKIRRSTTININVGKPVKTNKNKFKAGNIIKHHYQHHKDLFEYDKSGERYFKGQEIIKNEETLLIVGHDGKKHFIVCPLGDFITFQSRTYFPHGGFEKCFKILVNYVNDCCFPVS